MLDRETLIEYIEQHLEGELPIEDLAAWADDVFRDADFEPEHAEAIQRILSVVRDAVDSHRFRWEEPDWGQLVVELSDPDSETGQG